MNNKININPSSTKWLEKDDRVVADYFCDVGFRSLKQILDMRVFDLMNMQGLNAVRVEEVIICLYKWLNPNTAIDEAIYKDCNVEEEIVRSLDIERVRAALKARTPEERDIIMNFYFSENPLLGEALAEKFATTKSSIYRRRDHALRKLKSILGNA